jgi:hypothetical protein
MQQKYIFHGAEEYLEAFTVIQMESTISTSNAIAIETPIKGLIRQQNITNRAYSDTPAITKEVKTQV